MLFLHLIMKYNTCTLSNGLRIIHLPSTSPVVYCGYAINVGTRHEMPSEIGIAHFCEHATFKGTKHRRALSILNCLETVGGDLNAYTNKEETVYYSAVLKEHVRKAVDLLTDIVFHSTYPQHELDKEMEVICDEIESYNDSPAELIYDDFENILFDGHSLGHNILGKAEHLRGYKTEDVRQFVDRSYKPERMVFFAYGEISFDQLVRQISNATKGFASNEPLMNSIEGTEMLPDYMPRQLEKNLGTHQAHVMLGNRAYGVNEERRIALYLLNNILGGPGMNARLNLSLRERNGLVYTVESNMITYRDTGVWCIYFGCDPHDIKRCLRLVRRELDKFMEKPLSETQLRKAKSQLKGQIGVACDNRESFALDFGKTFLHYGREKDIANLFSQLDKITAEDIQAVAREIFAEDRMTKLVYR